MFFSFYLIGPGGVAATNADFRKALLGIMDKANEHALTMNPEVQAAVTELLHGRD